MTGFNACKLGLEYKFVDVTMRIGEFSIHRKSTCDITCISIDFAGDRMAISVLMGNTLPAQAAIATVRISGLGAGADVTDHAQPYAVVYIPLVMFGHFMFIKYAARPVPRSRPKRRADI